MFSALEARRTRDYAPIYPDADAVYAQDEVVDVTTLEAAIALPHAPDRVVPLREALGQPVQQAFLGTCTNGRL